MDDDKLLRYSRQILLPQVDIEGQQTLLDSRVLIIGLGGLGSPAAMYLAAAGIGTLVLSDDDAVDLSNLQRQIIHHTARIGQGKVDSAETTLRDLLDVNVVAIPNRLRSAQLVDEVGRSDVVLDCSDNFQTRFEVNAVCVATGTPLVSGAVIRFEGQLAVFQPGAADDSPCYHCLFPNVTDELDDSCIRNGVIAPLPGIIGSLQALEAIKLLLQIGTPFLVRLVLLDGLTMEWNALRLRRHPGCPTCA